MKIEDYALIGDCQTAALVGRDGSIDWLCFPRFDSGACFAALLGDKSNGRWIIAPAGKVTGSRRRYRGDTLVLETEFETAEGAVRVIDFMPIRSETPDIVRIVEGIRGSVPMQTELIVRFDYGSIVPWVRRIGRGLSATAGPDRLCLRGDVQLEGKDMTSVAEFTVAEGQRVAFDLSWHPSQTEAPAELDASESLAATEQWWKEWSEKAESVKESKWRDALMRSLITLKALTYAPTGGMVAAVTTSLPEQIGGMRNWDYRFCWLRDATFTLLSLLNAGYEEEAQAWQQWLLRAVAGDPSQISTVYGIGGERRLPELELKWLAGYEGSKPVRTGNEAHTQLQLDVFGEVADMLYQGRKAGLPQDEFSWSVQSQLTEFLEKIWQQPDDGIWEMRGPRRQFTHSKVMAWVAFDRAVKSIEEFKLEGPLERWRKLRDHIHEDVCRKGFHAERQSFVQEYGSDRLDASLLTLPLLGFLPASDERVKGTVRAIERELMTEAGFVRRYLPEQPVDGLPHAEGSFLLCSFWLADNYALQGRKKEAREMFERLLALRNDVGLLAEEYDEREGRLVGNFPQAFSHVGLINTAMGLTDGEYKRSEEAGGSKAA